MFGENERGAGKSASRLYADEDEDVRRRVFKGRKRSHQIAYSKIALKMSRSYWQRLLRSQWTTSTLTTSRASTSRLSSARAAFSTSARRELMEMTGFTDEQLTVREAISNICSKFPNTYWQERDQQEKDPKEFHAALAKDGWLGIALPESLGGAGLGTEQGRKT